MLPLPAGVTLGCTIEPPERRVSTGHPVLDGLLEGGFPRGRLSEVSGPMCSGRTTLLYGLLAASSRIDEQVALIDATDAFDPARAAAAGVRLPSLLWIRPQNARVALRCAEILLGVRGFAVVAVDLFDPQERLSAAAWMRLARRVRSSSAALILFDERRRAGSFVDLGVGLSRARPLWLQPKLLGGLETRVEILRQRRGAAGSDARLRFEAAA